MCKLYLKNNYYNSLFKNKEIIIRKKKLDNIRKKESAFPNKFRRNYLSKEIHDKFNIKNRIELEKLNIKVKIAGRIILKRIMGKASFLTIQDLEGRIQIYINKNKISKYQYNIYFGNLDIGDIIGIKGKLFKTKTGELSIYCKYILLITKSIRLLPDKFKGLSDNEIIYRQRYLDLISNIKSRETFKMRSKIISEIRLFMNINNFIEVETPMLQQIPGGASASPFITHHNKLKKNMYLRISPELYLKKLVIGGLEKIYELNRNFRNEGISTIHNPEFTMMELYIAYADYKDLILFIENMLCKLIKNIYNTNFILYKNKKIFFTKPFKKMTMKESIYFYNPKIKIRYLENIESAINIASKNEIKLNKKWKLGKIISKIFEKTTVNFLIQPTFITDYPIEISPMARANDNNKLLSERFEFFIGGMEIGNGFSELNDYDDQRIRFEEQLKNKNKINKKNIFFDYDYITALEYGLPPTAGLGLGIDRLIMILTNKKKIKDVILFPEIRSKKNKY
ncbi:MAG: lysine--tRNA ligase [Candidatus Makana argininalis]